MSRTIDAAEVDRLAEQFFALTGEIAPIAGGIIIGETDEEYYARRERWDAFSYRQVLPPKKEGLFF